ncbi:uncharacterized protein LOC106080300 isoform X1 [Biomphalaria glabrata]|uniref:EGF domain-specific O-linked N-acetylglucosamine transferase n=1 Tax=Biomphalaria glabrata TaxID=6526 RepID=A0A9W3A4P8_BIOGL|nr:uncharacterized protein LOC106080300 isoform X1 [Biomphalaria glabrata]
MRLQITDCKPCLVLRYRGIFTITPRRFRSYGCLIAVILFVNIILLTIVIERKYFSAVEEIRTGKRNLKTNEHVETQDILDKDKRSNKDVFTQHESWQTACSYRTTSYFNDKVIVLDQAPFVDYTKQMVCLENGNIASFADRFVLFKNALLHPTQLRNYRKGGEKIEDVWDQKEQDEYFDLLPGYFSVLCTMAPSFKFESPDHLIYWQNALSCYTFNKTNVYKFHQVSGLTIAIQRYEYVNLYHTMTDFYNAFVLMLIFGQSSAKVNILFVDAHPVGTLDEVWSTLFSKYIRAGRLTNTTFFSSLVWGMLGYFSPLNSHELLQVPYLTEFREFVLSKHYISASHVINCQNINVVIIWRRDYVAHPRNKQGQVVRKFDNEHEIVQQVTKWLPSKSNVTGIQLDSMHMKDQLEIIAQCDILIGMHGAGLSHILFLPSSSGVIEFKPSYSNPSLRHFEAMARWRKIPYSIWINNDPSNERQFYRTYIPADVIESEVKSMYSKICHRRSF